MTVRSIMVATIVCLLGAREWPFAARKHHNTSRVSNWNWKRWIGSEKDGSKLSVMPCLKWDLETGNVVSRARKMNRNCPLGAREMIRDDFPSSSPYHVSRLELEEDDSKLSIQLTPSCLECQLEAGNSCWEASRELTFAAIYLSRSIWSCNCSCIKNKGDEEIL